MESFQNIILRLMDYAEIAANLIIAGYNRGEDLLRETYTRVRDVSMTVVRAYAILVGSVVIWLTLSILSLLFGLLILKSSLWITGQAVISSLLCVVVYLMLLSPAKIVTFFASLLRFHCTSVQIESTAVAALYPLLSVAFFIAAFGSFLGIRGLQGISLLEVGIYTCFIIALIVLSMLTPGRTLRAHYLVLVIVIFNLLVFMFPIQGKALTGYVKRSSLTMTNWMNQGNKDGDLTVIPKSTTLYNDDGDILQVTNEEIKAKILDTESDDESGEDIYKVILPKQDGSYYKGIVAYVPVRSTMGIIEQKQENNITDHPSNSLNKSDQKNPNFISGIINFKAGKIVPTGINISNTEEYEFIPISGEFEIPGSTGWELVVNSVTIPGGHGGGLSIRGVTDGQVRIIPKKRIE